MIIGVLTVAAMVSGSRNTVNPLAVSAQRHYRDSNRVCCFSGAREKQSLVLLHWVLPIFLAKRLKLIKSSEMDPFDQYAGNIPSASQPPLREHH
jgi:hypothetical protein